MESDHGGGARFWHFENIGAQECDRMYDFAYLGKLISPTMIFDLNL